MYIKTLYCKACIRSAYNSYREEVENENPYNLANFIMKELLEAGVHIGHRVQRWNPKMKKFLYGTKQGIHIIDIIKSVKYLQYACSFLQSASTLNKTILFVGTKSTASDLVPLAAKECNGFYVKQRWLGGFLTNWNTMRKCIEKLEQLDNDLPLNIGNAKFDSTPVSNKFNISIESINGLTSSSYTDYLNNFGITSNADKTTDTNKGILRYNTWEVSSLTKKELLALKKQQMRLAKFFGGVKGMTDKPDIMVILGQNEEKNAVHESLKLQIPNITIVDTDCDPELADYCIPANDDSFRSIHIILQKLVKAYKVPFA